MKKLLLFVMIVTMLVSSAFSFKAIMVTDTGGLGDKSFNDGTWSGVLRAKNELKIEAEVIVSKEQTDYIPNLTDAAKRS
ncbi:MAG TPA: BMP family ABC transporter substrate-binding protein, partial [Petrotogaceae bacterium]|nr:BMP family ABC transporter substrate-binding protein [Petrotogaceae bacterium]